MSASTWVPLVTAAVGLIAGLAAGLVSTVLARRWASQDRAAAWQREDRLRWQADRLQLYARLISALDEWRGELRRALIDRHDGDPFDVEGWGQRVRAVSELVALAELTAPEQVRDLARRCYDAYLTIGSTLALGEGDPAAIHAEAGKAFRATGTLMEAMRADLGLGGDGQPVGW
jgi:hypothetical protein